MQTEQLHTCLGFCSYVCALVALVLSAVFPILMFALGAAGLTG